MGLNLMRIEDKLRPPAAVRREANRIVFSIEARGLREIDRAAKAERERIEQERAAIEAQIKAQPHRRDFTRLPADWPPGADTRLSEALGRFCAVRRLRDELYLAGAEYGERVRQARIALGLPGGQLSILDAGASAQTEAQIAARKDLALSRLAEAKGVLINI